MRGWHARIRDPLAERRPRPAKGRGIANGLARVGGAHVHLLKVRRASYPARDRVTILPSVKAGPRAWDIARLDWSMVFDARGQVSDTIAVRDVIMKKRVGRHIPMHSDLKLALQTLPRESDPCRLVRYARVEDCSSHSGRA